MYTPRTLNADATTTTVLLQLQLKIRDIFFTEAELLPILSQILLRWQRESVGEKFGLQRSTSHLEKLFIDAKISQIPLTAHFVLYFIANLEYPPIDAKFSQISLTLTEYSLLSFTLL